MEITQNKFKKNQMETQDSQKTTGVKTNTFCWREIRQLKAIANVKMINIYTT
jgi:hypothetical protein